MDRMANIEKVYHKALKRDTAMEKDERVRLGRLYIHFFMQGTQAAWNVGTTVLARVSFQLNASSNDASTKGATAGEDEIEEDMEYNDDDVKCCHGLHCIFLSLNFPTSWQNVYQYQSGKWRLLFVSRCVLLSSELLKFIVSCLENAGVPEDYVKSDTKQSDS